MSTTDDPAPLGENEQRVAEELNRRHDAVLEIERRNQVRLGAGTTLATPPAGMEDADRLIISNHGYTFAVVNKAHRGLNPSCTRPGFRILGLFESEDGDFRNWLDELKECGQIYVDGEDGETKCKLGDLHRLPVLKYMLIPWSEKRDRDRDYTEHKIGEIKDIHMEHVEMARKEFAEHREKKVQGKMGLSLEKQRQNARDKHGNAASTPTTHAGMKEVARVPRMMELRNQNHAIIIVLNDVTPDTLSGKGYPEPAIMILDAFDSCEDAERYMGRLKNYVFSVNLDIVDMYVWHFPEDIDFDKVKEKYRNPEQDKVMSEKKTRKCEVEDMEAKSRMEKLPLPVQEVTEHSKAPADFHPLKDQPEMTYTESSEPVDRERLEDEARQRERRTDKCPDTCFYPMGPDISKRMIKK